MSEAFYIGSLNIYDYQLTGFFRWNTLQAYIKENDYESNMDCDLDGWPS